VDAGGLEESAKPTGTGEKDEQELGGRRF